MVKREDMPIALVSLLQEAVDIDDLAESRPVPLITYADLVERIAAACIKHLGFEASPIEHDPRPTIAKRVP